MSSAALPLRPGAAATGGHRTARRRAVTGLPGRQDLVDAGFVLLTGAIAVWGFRTTFDSVQFLWAGIAGLVIGIVVAHLATALRAHWLVLALAAVVAFFLFGGAIALRTDTIAGLLPTGHSVLTQAVVSATGWKDMLTTLPPVDGSGQFLVIPYLLALLAGVLGMALARRSTRPGAPALVAVTLFAVVVLLGTTSAPAVLLHGLALTAVLFLWTALRRRRMLRIVGTGSRIRSQVLIGAALVVAATAGAWGIGILAPPSSAGRVVLRNYVEPPFDVSAFPSPLVGFRTYTKGNAKTVWNLPLLTVGGLSAGDRIRFAVLDDYSGYVWGAANPQSGVSAGFRKVGSVIDAPSYAAGAARTVTITVDAGYAGLADVNAWVPSLGYASDLTFQGQRAGSLADSLRYDTDTGQALVTARLATGDTVVSTQEPVTLVPSQGFQPATGADISPVGVTLVQPYLTKWAAGKSTPWTQVQAAATHLRSAGAYSDGSASGQAYYLPGHSLARLATFLKAPQPVGDDEQYAAAFALMADAAGVPARVVLGAVVPASGPVEGKDVHAWVEVRGADGDWYAVPDSMFMPDPNQHPHQTTQPPTPATSAADIPPPNTQLPPAALDSAPQVTANATVKPPSLLGIPVPTWLIAVLRWASLPVGLLVLVIVLLAAARGIRRRGRRSHGRPERRLAQGWLDLVDHARDLGTRVPVGLTRVEQARLVGRPDLAAHADRAVFGPSETTPEAVGAFWQAVRSARKDLSAQAGRRRRMLRLFSLRSLLTRERRPVEQRPGRAAGRSLRPRSLTAPAPEGPA